MIAGTIAVTAPIAPTSTGDQYPTHLATYGKGGYRTVVDASERDSIPSFRREAYMKVVLSSTGIEYSLEPDLITWTAVTPSAGGDMLRSVYDTDNNGIVDNSEALNGQNAAYYLSRTNHTGTQAISTITGLQTNLTNLQNDINTKLNISEVGVSVCELVGGFVPNSRINLSPLQWKGTWNANTNNPPISDATGANGDLYKVSVAGTQDLGSGSISYNVGDWVSHNGTIFEKNGDANLVQSVNGQVGVVVLTSDDVAQGTTNYYLDVDQKIALDNTAITPNGLNWFVTVDEMNAAIAAISFPAGAITSVFGRTGVVTAQNNDYNAGQIACTPVGSITATNVQTALSQINALIAGITVGNAFGLTTISSNTTLNSSHKTVFVSTSGINIQLPLSTSYPPGQPLIIKDISFDATNSPITFTMQGSDVLQLNGVVNTSSGELISDDGLHIYLVSNGAGKWYIINQL